MEGETEKIIMKKQRTVEEQLRCMISKEPSTVMEERSKIMSRNVSQDNDDTNVTKLCVGATTLDSMEFLPQSTPHESIKLSSYMADVENSSSFKYQGPPETEDVEESSMASLLRSARHEAIALIIDEDSSGTHEHQIPPQSHLLENPIERLKNCDDRKQNDPDVHSIESLLESARREAVSLVIHEDNDDKSGIFEHQIPRISSKKQKDVAQHADDMSEKRVRVRQGGGIEGDFEYRSMKSLSKYSRRNASSHAIMHDEYDKAGSFECQNPADRCRSWYWKEISTHHETIAKKTFDIPVGGDNVATNVATSNCLDEQNYSEEDIVLKCEKSQRNEKFDDPLHYTTDEVDCVDEQGSIRKEPYFPISRNEINGRNTALPGAFREGGLDPTLETENSDDDDRWTETTTTMENLQNSPDEILVSAELVSDEYLYGPAFCEIVNRESILVEASPMLNQDHSIFFFWPCSSKNIRAQLCLLVAILVIIGVGISIVLLTNTNKTLVLHQNQDFDSFRTPSAPPTNSEAPTSENNIVLKNFVEKELSFATKDKLADPYSAQYRALSWMKNDSKLTEYSYNRLIQRFVLATFYFDTGGPIRWSRADNWLTETHECSWFMKKPNGETNCMNGTLHHFIMDRNGLGGSLPEELSLLKDLKSLNLGLNSLTGTIPGIIFRGMPHLLRLTLYGNMISGTLPTEVGALTSLERMEIFTNGLKGPLPSEIGLLTNVHTIYAIQNFLSDQIPSEIGLLSKLQALWLSQNLLLGTVPTELGNIVNLEDLKVADNMLSGTIPTEVGNLTKLRKFEIQRNGFKGKMPSELGKLKQIEMLNVGNNTISGTIPIELSEARNITFLSVYANHLTGTIPTEFGNLKNLKKLYLDQNFFSGTLPSELGLLTNLSDFWAESNNFRGSVPTEICNMRDSSRIKLDCSKINCICLE